MSNLEQAIRERAYHLWVADGCGDGAADAYWLNAQRELLSASLSGSELATQVETQATATAPKKVAAKAKAAKAAAPAKSKRRAA
jgi:hypothetical protein